MKSGMENLFVIEACLVQNPIDTWVLDSGAPNHICNSLYWFQENKLRKRQAAVRDRTVRVSSEDWICFIIF